MSRWNKYILAFFFLGGGFSIILFGGYLAGIHELPPYWFLRRVELHVFGRTFEKIKTTENPEYYDSIFLRLYSNQIDISDRINREGRGGGLTSFGDAVVLLAHDGQIFAAYSADDIRNTDITVPENGFSAYQKAAELDEFKDLKHNFGLYRYNDILFYESERHRGLAVSYTEFDSTENCYRNAVATLPVDGGIRSIEQLSVQSDDWEIIYRTQPCLELKSINNALEGGLAGGRIAFQTPSTIFLGSGDYHWDGMYAPKAIAQDPIYEYGKIIGIDLDSRSSRIVATGIRNPQGVTVDNTGTLWTVEHGLRGGDELNHIEEGNNYGWPVETLGTQYSKLPVPNILVYGRHDTFKEPIFAWLPSVAISSLTSIQGFHESWDGDLLMGSLKTMSLFHTRIKDNRVLFSEEIKIGERLRYVHQHTDGRLVIWTDSKKLIFLTGQPYTDNFVKDYLVESIGNEKVRNNIKTTIDGCRQCHSIEPSDHINAPSLASIFGSEIGSTNYQYYSEALQDKTGNWTHDNLKEFIKDPQGFAPGTTMPNPGISDNTTLEELINLLEVLSKRSPN
ncbi:PQQ-dependent sugar dehydrogenase [Fodinibius sp. N2]|uniref:PQQ-dependent sugar dehydrogenase n=1 Tax=Fodinibius alkaliphilus TaxID=3140241 RepID=UPI00315B197A